MPRYTGSKYSSSSNPSDPEEIKEMFSSFKSSSSGWKFDEEDLKFEIKNKNNYSSNTNSPKK
jgi:hypothetical protein